jgi:hypothetical protein
MATATVVKTKKSAKAPAKGRFGVYGGRYVPETLMAALEELEREYERAKRDRGFHRRLDELLRTYAGRPTPLFFARRLTQKLRGAKIYLKREDLLHTGAHKINNCLGQGLLAERMGKRRIIAETGAGQHGVATATVCALLGFECVVYMGTEDMRRQELNVFRMRLLGAEVRGVNSGSRTLKDAINEAMRDWVTNVRTTHYLLGSVQTAHCDCRLRRWRLKFHRHFLSFHQGQASAADRRRSRRTRRDFRRTCRTLSRRLSGRTARNFFLSPAGRGGAGGKHAFCVRWPRLSFDRPGARGAL